MKNLKKFEQQDYKRGGVSISPEMYEAIATKIYNEVVKPQVIAKEHFRKQMTICLIQMQDKKDCGY